VREVFCVGTQFWGDIGVAGKLTSAYELSIDLSCGVFRWVGVLRGDLWVSRVAYKYKYRSSGLVEPIRACRLCGLISLLCELKRYFRLWLCSGIKDKERSKLLII
jgi:hypothetical protein